MDYDFRARTGPPYDAHNSMYRPTTTNTTNSSSLSDHGSSLYPRVGPSGGHGAVPLSARTPSFQQNTSSSPSSGMGIRVAIKPEYRITPPPQLSPIVGEIPRSTFQFDFDFEKKVLAEVDKDGQNWIGFAQENLPSRTTESTSSVGCVTDPVVSKYIASGLSREAVPFAVANFGDNPTKVREFVNGYNLLREMGFPSNSVAEALGMYDNDTDKALAHFLNSSS
ncbi:hypothetical protein MKX01_022790 [Papaver californicum]|nr:hypothetical protein MKX01_022790 [Papaver californicum]